jgi:low temperature requirement protein LtrA
MAPRWPHEPHRAATVLELFFDLVFVVAIAQASEGLHHSIADAHALRGLVGYLLVFFCIWWAWMNFTWFASAYDCDDVPYRLAVLVQMSGALMLAADVARMFETHTPNAGVLGGYVLMRLAMVAQWCRAAASDPSHRRTAVRYAAGIATCQLLWLVVWPLPENQWLVAFLFVAALELAVPIWAERAALTPWHAHHITERYGLFTIIVLGESVFAGSAAIRSAMAAGEALALHVPLILGGLLIVYSMWWIYFDQPAHDLLTSVRRAFVWGYGHYAIFAAAAAVGAGLAVAVDQATGRAPVSTTVAGAAVAVPVAVYLVCLWILHYRPEYQPTRWFGPAAAALVLLTPLTAYAVPLIGVILATLVAAKIVVLRPAPVSPGPADA